VPGKPVVKWLTHYDQYGLAFSIIVDYGGPGLPVAPRAPSRIILEQVGLHHERCASPACSLLALSGHAARAQECPLWGKADTAIALQNIDSRTKAEIIVKKLRSNLRGEVGNSIIVWYSGADK